MTTLFSILRVVECWFRRVTNRCHPSVIRLLFLFLSPSLVLRPNWRLAPSEQTTPSPSESPLRWLRLSLTPFLYRRRRTGGRRVVTKDKWLGSVIVRLSSRTPCNGYISVRNTVCHLSLSSQFLHKLQFVLVLTVWGLSSSRRPR